MVAITGQFSSFNALLQLQRVDQGEQQALARLSSGERIQEAGQDPSGLALANDLRGEIRALREAKRAHFDGFNTIQLADRNLEEVTEILYRVSELASQAASTTLGGDGTVYNQAIDIEYQELLAEIDQINDTLRINGNTLFAGAGTTVNVNASTDLAGTEENVAITFSAFDTTVLGLAGTDMNTTAGAGAILEQVGQAIALLSRQRGRLGAVQDRLERNMNQIDERMIEFQDRELEIRGTNVADETTELAKFEILRQSNIAVVAQSNLDVDRIFQLLS